MAEEARIYHEAGQSVAVFTADRQLYRVALDILWAYEHDLLILCQGLVVCTGSLVSLGVLVKNSGLLSWLKSAFGGAEKMLTGKTIPMNARSLR